MSNESLNLITAINSLIGYLESLDNGSVVTKAYRERLWNHYIPNLQSEIQKMLPSGVISSKNTEKDQNIPERDHFSSEIPVVGEVIDHIGAQFLRISHQGKMPSGEAFLIVKNTLRNVYGRGDIRQATTASDETTPPASEHKPVMSKQDKRGGISRKLVAKKTVNIKDAERAMLEVPPEDEDGYKHYTDLAKACAEVWGLSYVE